MTAIETGARDPRNPAAYAVAMIHADAELYEHAPDAPPARQTILKTALAAIAAAADAEAIETAVERGACALAKLPAPTDEAAFARSDAENDLRRAATVRYAEIW